VYVKFTAGHCQSINQDSAKPRCLVNWMPKILVSSMMCGVDPDTAARRRQEIDQRMVADLPSAIRHHWVTAQKDGACARELHSTRCCRFPPPPASLSDFLSCTDIWWRFLT
jgi:hypothetical protein